MDSLKETEVYKAYKSTGGVHFSNESTAASCIQRAGDGARMIREREQPSTLRVSGMHPTVTLPTDVWPLCTGKRCSDGVHRSSNVPLLRAVKWTGVVMS